ncbi:uncharacterized protein CTHT_0013260 [Thermochaetoides thermophila DSM 1495]|uniref:Uncharacterized protein n=1 Tax=Chaetomium thermophilum (strain DSM 1495 / CBS 144.50 / IMI 039719) TaxID=759272 RepID=G0S1E0_CHATD|nr:hypothetical protein CTHT_0013260 [Thermochaetoides thermophila DSM 1495]EGS22850.1 hypothetical protein CTHT_0013260 [Thermochaetoides thermophila DSM 1495]
MPSKTKSPSSPAPSSSTSTDAPVKRFELPALDLNFGSLTDGTDIPPPLPSPIQEEPSSKEPGTPKEENGDAAKDNANGSSKHDVSSPQSTSTPTSETTKGASTVPTSPTLSARPGSIRRLFSRGLLNPAHAAAAGANGDRPQSRGTGSIADSTRKSKRASGWFGRLRGGSHDKCSSPLASSPQSEEKKDPPPMLPELSELNRKLGIHGDDVGFGDDLFKDIK